MIINAEKIKIKGVSLFKKILKTYDEVIVNYRGENKYAIIDLIRYLDLEDYKNKIVYRKNNPQFVPKTITINHLQTQKKRTANYEKKVDKAVLKMRNNKEIVYANDVKTKGVSSFRDLLSNNKLVVINVRGVDKFIVLKLEEYKELLTIEQNLMYEKAISEEEKHEISFSEDDDIDKFIKSLIKSDI